MQKGSVYMTIQTMTQNGRTIARIHSDAVQIRDVQSALDLLMNVKQETGCDRIALNKEAFCEEFFILSTRLAGEILQKFINYQTRLAVYGDFSRYTSKPLRDFFYESNQGRDIFFVATAEEAVEKLSRVD